MIQVISEQHKLATIRKFIRLYWRGKITITSFTPIEEYVRNNISEYYEIKGRTLEAMSMSLGPREITENDCKTYLDFLIDVATGEEEAPKDYSSTVNSKLFLLIKTLASHVESEEDFLVIPDEKVELEPFEKRLNTLEHKHKALETKLQTEIKDINKVFKQILKWQKKYGSILDEFEKYWRNKING